ncbi:hypothetical protein IK146_01740 [Candidatus Saccharibacteria bacterium]|nr:hypothetical protein [Candidatus Saccharibacteria bacterium]
MNNDELQRAIDDITKDNSAPAEAAPVVDATAENEQLANELTQPATASTMGAGVDLDAVAPDFAAAPAPVIPDTPGMPPVDTVEPVETAPAVAPEEPEAEPLKAEVPEAPVAVTATPVAAEDDADTLTEALKELYPLLDKVDMPMEEKFDITMQFGGPAKALEFAKQITDETAKANALLEIVNRLK